MKKILLLFIVILICGCSRQIKDDFFAMDTYMSISIYGSDEDANAIKSLVFGKDNKFKRDNIDVNDEETRKLIDYSLSVSEFTNGNFDITVAPLCDIWGFWNNKFHVPTKSQIDEALKKVGYNKINADTKFDFGAIAKGYTGDCIKELARERGIKSGIVTLGGNVQTIGAKPNGDGWIVGIKNPANTSEYTGYVTVTDKAVVTSGGYERFFEENGKRYVHILNPKTGYPAESDMASVTVISDNGALADALSTAFYTMGIEETKKLCEKSQFKFGDDAFAVIITDRDSKNTVLGNVIYNER